MDALRECDGGSRRLGQVAIDIALCVLVTVGFFAAHSFGVPVQRGFFCSDESIRFPFVPMSTVSSTLLMGAGLSVPLVVMLFLESFHAKRTNQRSFTSAAGRQLGKVYFLFLYGWMTTICTSEVIKLGTGRLRPHFIDACKPDWRRIDCSQGYITNFTCTNADVTEAQLLDARRSFPSGHAASAAFACLFFGMYLRSRLSFLTTSTVLLSSVFQSLLALAAVMVALTRLMDNKHHFTDVLTGSALGCVVAVWVMTSHRKQLRFLEHDKPASISRQETTEDDSAEVDSAAITKHPAIV